LSWIIFILLLFLAVFLIYRLNFFKTSDIPFKYLSLAYILKILVGVVFIWLYTYHYSNRSQADVFKYFDDGKVLFDVSKVSTKDYLQLSTGISSHTEELTKVYLSESRFWDKSPSLPFINDNRFIIRFNALLMSISRGNIYVHLLVANFLSFLGLFYLFQFFRRMVNTNKYLLFILIFFLPSILFWTSSILKESFLILSLGGFLYYLLNLKEGKFSALIPLLFFSIIMAMSKIYVLLILIPITLSFLWSNGKNDKLNILRYTLVNLFFIALALNIGIYWPEYDIKSILSFKQSEFKCLAEWTGAGSTVFIPDIDTSTLSFIKAIPHAILNSLARPFPWDRLNYLSFMAMLEISSLYLLLIYAFRKRKTEINYTSNIMLFSINFIFLLALLIGWTTPVLGAIVRYRIVILPFMIIISLIILDTKKLSKFVALKN